MAILSTLVRHEVASHELIEAVGTGPDAVTKTAKAQVHNVRVALEAIMPSLGNVIVSEKGRGYRLDMSELLRG